MKGSKILLDLLRLIAYQVGSEVSLSELGSKIGADTKTVARYLDLFEKSFVILNLRGFSRNLRKEVTKKSKYYFYDLGIRNAIISNFNSIDARNDIGALWENFCVIERLKMRTYRDIYANQYFWRTWDHKEIDLIEEREGKLFGYECKYADQGGHAYRSGFARSSRQAGKNKAAWLNTYSEASFELITRASYLDFIL